MKTETKVSNLTQDELVNLLCTATYNSDNFSASRLKSEDKQFEGEQCESMEERWAHRLLHGGHIRVTDYYAEGELYGDLPNKRLDSYDNGKYIIDLHDIEQGLAKAADDTAARFCVARLADEDSGDFDEVNANVLMQFILFGEWVYA